MQHDFLSELMDSKVRAKVLRLFVLNENERFTAGEIARRVGSGVTTAEKEVKQLVKMGIVKQEKHTDEKVDAKRKKQTLWTFDGHFKHRRALATFIHEVAPVQYREVEDALKGTGRLSIVVLSGVFTGDRSRPADLLIVGDFMNEKRLERAMQSFEPRYGEIRYAVLSTPEFRYRMTIQDKLVRDTLDYPHRVLLNKTNLL